MYGTLYLFRISGRYPLINLATNILFISGSLNTYAGYICAQ